MKIETTFSCGDKGWTFTGSHVVQRTIGQVRIEFTKSPGIGDAFMEGGVASYSGGNQGQVADNYAPMLPKLVEQYMCVETGIGSGNIYTLGESIFLTEEECRIACADQIREEEERKASVARHRREETLRNEPFLRAQLAEIERLKAAA
jgi:hypothetical protein